ncbi:NUDIX hydrolase [Puniceicoccaceae bacterium K14]|nr:NUDIX hydrolase [Puniceicoccaceae bacterium K14]
MSDEGSFSDEKSPSKWDVLSSETITTNQIFTLKAKQYRHPIRGSEGSFFSIESNDWVKVLPITKDGQVALVHQYRFGVEKTSWELPGGVIDSGEDPIVAGLRELSEETGFTSERHRLMCSLHPNPAIQNNTCHLVLAEECELTENVSWDEHEELEIKLFPIDEVYQMALRGEIFHSLSIATLFHYYPEYLKFQARRRP